MTKKLIAVVTASLLAVCFVSAPVRADDDDDSKPKYTTKQVMKAAMKGPLLKKVAKGEGTEEDKKKLHDMLVALSKNKPKKGDEESWKKLTTALVKASTAAVEGDPDAGKMLTAAANCKACHTPHK